MFLKGLVEFVDDPLKLGRVKVRIIGKHSPNKTKPDDYDFLKTEDLPYAMPISPVGASSISGICNFSVPEINSVVVCGYFDEDEQELFYIGTLGLLGKTKIDGFGIESNPNPLTEYPYSPLVSGTNTIEELDITSAIPASFVVPQSGYATEYPYNKVIETAGGHVIEIDDTSGAERIRVKHKSGSFRSTDKDGNTIEYATGNLYLIGSEVCISGDLKVNGKIISNVSIEDPLGTMEEMRGYYNLHTHPTAPSGPVSTPSVIME